MVSAQVVLDNVAFSLLQFGGDLIGLAIVFLVLAVVSLLL